MGRKTRNNNSNEDWRVVKKKRFDDTDDILTAGQENYKRSSACFKLDFLKCLIIKDSRR